MRNHTDACPPVLCTLEVCLTLVCGMIHSVRDADRVANAWEHTLGGGAAAILGVGSARADTPGEPRYCGDQHSGARWLCVATARLPVWRSPVCACVRLCVRAIPGADRRNDAGR